MANEQVFLDERGVSVSNSRMMYDGQTYAMSGITSVKSFEKKPSRILPIILIIMGLVVIATGGGAIVVGLLFISGGIAAWFLMKPEYSVVLTSSSGEAKAYTSKDKGFVLKIIGAVNEAIVHRG
ncbi:MAG: DUF6232 family protein [Deltaproteobacteria bacterium]|nr:DUF6232 family protein [Deltaproteobacteria bacterium]